jgi:hypothetical protein
MRHRNKRKGQKETDIKGRGEEKRFERSRSKSRRSRNSPIKP